MPSPNGCIYNSINHHSAANTAYFAVNIIGKKHHTLASTQAVHKLSIRTLPRLYHKKDHLASLSRVCQFPTTIMFTTWRSGEEPEVDHTSKLETMNITQALEFNVG